jgi:hypothetical protein
MQPKYEIQCPICCHNFVAIRETCLCPSCGTKITFQKPETFDAYRVDDFYRYRWLCKLADMFGAGGKCFIYYIQRFDTVVEIRRCSPAGKQATTIFRFDDPEERKIAEMKRIISLIVNFAAV